MNIVPYWLRLMRLFRHYRGKSTVLPYYPLRIWLELTSECNYRCVMCPNKKLPASDKGMMIPELIPKIIDEAKDFVHEINFTHRGETLLHPGFIEAVERAHSYGIYTRNHNNGSLLTEDLSRRIVRSGLDRISFSFDGYDKETYEKIRKGGDFQATLNNIFRFLEIKKELGSQKPETALEIINFHPDKTEELLKKQKEFAARFDGLPLDHFVIKDLHNWAGELKIKSHKRHYSVCPFPWNALIICWDGSVVPCTQDFFGYNIVGNVKDSSLREIWNSEKMIDLRKKLIERRIQDLKACSGCDRPWRKGILGVPKEYLWKFITKKMP